jgi:hypothetical protein
MRRCPLTSILSPDLIITHIFFAATSNLPRSSIAEKTKGGQPVKEKLQNNSLPALKPGNAGKLILLAGK